MLKRIQSKWPQNTRRSAKINWARHYAQCFLLNKNQERRYRFHHSREAERRKPKDLTAQSDENLCRKWRPSLLKDPPAWTVTGCPLDYPPAPFPTHPPCCSRDMEPSIHHLYWIPHRLLQMNANTQELVSPAVWTFMRTFLLQFPGTLLVNTNDCSVLHKRGKQTNAFVYAYALCMYWKS